MSEKLPWFTSLPFAWMSLKKSWEREWKERRRKRGQIKKVGYSLWHVSRWNGHFSPYLVIVFFFSCRPPSLCLTVPLITHSDVRPCSTAGLAEMVITTGIASVPCSDKNLSHTENVKPVISHSVRCFMSASQCSHSDDTKPTESESTESAKFIPQWTCSSWILFIYYFLQKAVMPLFWTS